MGAILSSLSKLFATKKPYSICMIGLDAAGKTTILYQMQVGTTTSTLPTIGFNVEKFHVGNVEFKCWDIGGQDKIRRVWSSYVELSNGIVFVVDITDEARWEDAGYELRNILEGNEHMPLLILANKADDPEDPDLPLKEKRMLEALKVDEIKNLYTCRNVTAITSGTDHNPLTRLLPAFKWMVEALENGDTGKVRQEL
ncbi:GTP-binding ADP-ribosylation factor Arf1 [Pseudoloma neurophilia]|uniref:GTP-binding ADP-ribosylation factor Arf1 n=1 Tax=Pseudoloma neurophilia TaxID=146866 RepID=A0A0R0LUW2_9MICR|nr:GTP-binding ADP-ribosylation factor Arf1 [Pseudoloma neurophilia]